MKITKRNLIFLAGIVTLFAALNIFGGVSNPLNLFRKAKKEQTSSPLSDKTSPPQTYQYKYQSGDVIFQDRFEDDRNKWGKAAFAKQ